MPEYIKVPEYAKIKGVHERTIYRWIKNSDINARTIDGVLHVEVDDNSFLDNSKVVLLLSENSQLRKDIEFLKARLEQAQDTIDNLSEERQRAQERSDTIILQLTRQLESKQKQLSDMRERSLWRRFKVALGFG